MAKTESEDAKPRWERPLIISIIIAGLALGLLLGRVIWIAGPGSWCIDTTHDLLLRFTCIAALIAIGWASVRWIAAIDSVERRTAWWSIGAKAKKPTWDDVRRMTLGQNRDDPVRYLATGRPTAVATVAKMTLGWLLAGSLMLPAAALVLKWPAAPIVFLRDAEGTDISTASNGLADPPAANAPAGSASMLPCLPTTAAQGARNAMPKGCKLIGHPDTNKLTSKPADVNLNLNGNLTALLALVAAAVSIVFTHQQLQAKVKADSRQAWISTLRANIARFTALADTVHTKPTSRSTRNEQELTTRRLEMELMLNPSEKDHRLLMYLSLKIAFFDGPAGFQQVDDVKNLEAAIKISVGYVEADWQPLLKSLPTRKTDESAVRQQYSDLIGYTMRLAHVVLKREWEQVKATR